MMLTVIFIFTNYNHVVHSRRPLSVYPHAECGQERQPASGVWGLHLFAISRGRSAFSERILWTVSCTVCNAQAALQGVCWAFRPCGQWDGV